MKWRKAVIAAVLLTVPVWAQAQTVTQDGGRTDPDRRGTGQGMVVGGIIRADTTFKILTFDSDGNLKTAEASRDRNFYGTGTFINNQIEASGAAMSDSSIAVPTYYFSRTGLMLYGIHDSLSTVVRIAVQVRAHATAGVDTLSSFPWLRWANAGGVPGGTSAGIFRVDSIGHANGNVNIPTTPVQTTIATVAAASPYLLPGEFEVIFNVNRGDSTAAGVGKPGSSPVGMYVPLVGPLGEWFWAPYTSVRVRVINGVRSRFRLMVKYVGGAL